MILSYFIIEILIKFCSWITLCSKELNLERSTEASPQVELRSIQRHLLNSLSLTEFNNGKLNRTSVQKKLEKYIVATV